MENLLPCPCAPFNACNLTALIWYHSLFCGLLKQLQIGGMFSALWPVTCHVGGTWYGCSVILAMYKKAFRSFRACCLLKSTADIYGTCKPVLWTPLLSRHLPSKVNILQCLNFIFLMTSPLWSSHLYSDRPVWCCQGCMYMFCLTNYWDIPAWAYKTSSNVILMVTSCVVLAWKCPLSSE